MTDPLSVSKGGIKLVEQSQAKTTTGTIVSCGANVDNNPLLCAGARVLLNSYRMGSTVVEIEGTEHVLVPSKHIAAAWTVAQSTASLDNLQPCRGRVLVQVEPVLEKTGGGVLLPDQAKDKPCTGTVCAMGQADEDDAVDAASLRPGTRIVFFK
ncbi:hypothetical protein H632_c205p0 [Helicosporidium sp. ATCC 50920]|nr:hypothetical protein H632_c205p0 [Helicosporidium sp. ATCC 50920]|eukprot:KDD76496.1 hypothetical protein H632_c205p0 [Helicosporidium sp. ATCC 50920]